MKKLLYSIVLLLYISFLSANTLDSLLQVTTHQTIISEVDHYNEIAFLAADKHKDSIALHYSIKAQKLALDSNYIKGQGDAFVRLGIIYTNQNNYKKALQNYQRGSFIREQLKDTSGLSNVLTNIGNLYIELGEYSKANQMYHEALKWNKLLDDKYEVAYLKTDIASTYLHLFQYKKAIAAITKAQSDFHQLSDEYGLAITYFVLGQIQTQKKQYQKAKEHFLKAKAVFDIQSPSYATSVNIELGDWEYSQQNFRKALSYYLESIKAVEAQNKQYRLAQLYTSTGLCYEALGEKELAINYHLKSLVLRKKLDNDYKTLLTQKNIGYFYKNQNEYSKSIDILKECYFKSQTANFNDISLETTIYLADIFSKQQQYDSAYHYSILYNTLKDSILQDEQKTIEYLTRQENQIELLEAKNKLTTEKLVTKQMQTYLWLGLLSSLLFIGGAAFWIWRERQRKLLAIKNEKLSQQEIQTILSEQKAKSLQAQFEGREKERQRISKDLHDRLGGMLATVKLYYQTAEEKLDLIKLEAAEYYQKANTLLDEACDEVRRISHDLSSNVLIEFGLSKALDSLCERLTNTGKISIDFIPVQLESIRLTQQTELELYRITQELLSNVIKHSKAKEVSVQLSYYDEEQALNLIVEDDGQGFDTSNYKPGIGLSNIRLGIENLGGLIEIDSQIGAGTTVNIQIPLTPTNK